MPSYQWRWNPVLLTGSYQCPEPLSYGQPGSPRANDSPSYSSENNGSSDCSTANQEPSAHCLLGCLRGKGHCTFSGLQSHFSDGAILPWPPKMPAAKAATTLRSKKIITFLLEKACFPHSASICLEKSASQRRHFHSSHYSWLLSLNWTTRARFPMAFFLLSASKCAIPYHTLAWLILPTVDLGLCCYSPNLPEPHNRLPSQQDLPNHKS